MTTRPKRNDDGFTLIEVLIALMIVALSLGALYEGMLGGVTAGHVTAATREALSRAQSHMEAIGHGMTPGAYTRSGEDGHHFHWRITMTPVESNSHATLYHVRVTESWPDTMTATGERSVTLTSLRTGPTGGTP